MNREWWAYTLRHPLYTFNTYVTPRWVFVLVWRIRHGWKRIDNE